MTVCFCWHDIAVLVRADFHFGGFVTQRLTTVIDKKKSKVWQHLSVCRYLQCQLCALNSMKVSAHSIIFLENHFLFVDLATRVQKIFPSLMQFDKINTSSKNNTRLIKQHTSNQGCFFLLLLEQKQYKQNKVCSPS